MRKARHRALTSRLPGYSTGAARRACVRACIVSLALRGRGDSARETFAQEERSLVGRTRVGRISRAAPSGRESWLVSFRCLVDPAENSGRYTVIHRRGRDDLGGNPRPGEGVSMSRFRTRT